jgi:hypothetical protein
MDQKTKSLPTIPDDYAQKLMAGVAASRATMSTGGGGAMLMKMDREGVWNFSQQNELVQKGSRWIVNPTLFGHGWVCWVQAKPGVKGRKAGELMCSMVEDFPAEPPLAEGKYPWAKQYSCVLKCMEGDDEGTETLYKGSSMGGTEAMADLIDAFKRNFAVDRAHPCPVVTLESSSYPNTTYGGRTFKPVFNIVGWSDMNGSLATGEPAAALEEPEQAQAEEPAPPARKRKEPLRDARTADEAAMAEPVPTQQVHVGQRRRPAAR